VDRWAHAARENARRGMKRGIVRARRREAKIAATGGDLPIGARGLRIGLQAVPETSGSIPTLSHEYGGEDDQGGVYHSNY